MILKSYIPLCDALVLLMRPLVEIVIHDLNTHKICYIKGELSKRRVGDDSLLDIQEKATGIQDIIYPKINFDGRLIKSISVPLEDKWLVCINCDISVFNQFQKISELFLKIDSINPPKNLFKNDWQEKLHITIHHFIHAQNWSFENLTGFQKKELIKHLYESGAFSEKKAADYITTVLKISRATIFNYLKQWRKNDSLSF